MYRKWIIIAAIGEKGRSYGIKNGSGNPMPVPLANLVVSSGADSWTITNGGALAYFVSSRHALERLERLFERAETLRGQLPSIAIGIARGFSKGRLNWLGKLKRNCDIDYAAEERALANVQGPQIYKQTLEYMQAEMGYGPMKEFWQTLA